MSRLSNYILLCCLGMSLVACSSAGEKPSALRAQAIKQSERGESAFLRGDYVRAVHEYELALRLDLAAENASGIAVARINLARVWLALSNSAQAQLQLDSLFTPPTLVYPSDTLAIAATMQAQLSFLRADRVAIFRWVEEGERLCQSKCSALGSLFLLRAQMALQERNFAEAHRLVADAVKHLDAESQIVELANAMRLSGEIYLAEGDAIQAQSHLEQALVLDQRAGVPVKIHADLLLLGQVAAYAGKLTAAQNYQARAQSVAKAAALPR